MTTLWRTCIRIGMDVVGIRRLVGKLLVRPTRAYVRHLPWAPGREFLHYWFAWRPHRAITKTFFGYRMECVCPDLTASRIYWFGVWEPNLTALLSDRLSKGKLFVDVGANIGYFTLLAAKLVGDSGQVLALEPSPSTFQKLQRNVELNAEKFGSSGIVSIENKAAGEVDGMLPLYSGPPGNTGEASLIPTDRPVEGLVPVVRLDDLVSAEMISCLGAVKIDVEGAELQVLRGAISILENAASGTLFIIEVIESTHLEVLAMMEEYQFTA